MILLTSQKEVLNSTLVGEFNRKNFWTIPFGLKSSSKQLSEKKEVLKVI